MQRLRKRRRRVAAVISKYLLGSRVRAFGKRASIGHLKSPGQDSGEDDADTRASSVIRRPAGTARSVTKSPRSPYDHARTKRRKAISRKRSLWETAGRRSTSLVKLEAKWRARRREESIQAITLGRKPQSRQRRYQFLRCTRGHPRGQQALCQRDLEESYKLRALSRRARL
ncbi:hypothetical protein DFH11DRAFT_1634259 [Phellopilus nigrolimitatus]|nr:hypothetical protein DFH11DRAFT_1634259 [Phellopilus nigrolimitatus]